jgi:hypothetical protein
MLSGESDEPGRLEAGLVPLVAGVRPPRDARTGPEPQDVVVVPEGADRDGELGRPPVGIDPSHRSAVVAARGGFEIGDELERSELGRPGDRARRERRREQVVPADVVAQPRLDIGDEVDESADPVRATMDRSLRTRSTIMMFSAWSLAVRSLAVRPVPLIGPEVTMRSPVGDVVTRRKSSGLAQAIDRPGMRSWAA